MKCKLIRPMEHTASGKLLPAGHVIDHRDAHWLVGMGVALPEDDECAVKCGMTPEQMQTAQKAYEEGELGIHPDDKDAYRAGWMVGYKRTADKPQNDLLGNTSNIWVPGPKFAEYAALLQEAVDEALAADDDEPADPVEPATEADESGSEET